MVLVIRAMSAAEPRWTTMQEDHDTAQAGEQTVLYLGRNSELPAFVTPLLAEHGIALVSADCATAVPFPGDVPVPDVPLGDGYPGGLLEGQGTRRFLALILDTSLMGCDQTLKSWLETLARNGISARHLLVLAHTREIGLRLQALRAGAAACFVAPVPVAVLTDAVLLACRPQPKTARRVLVVDDDAPQTLLLERFLTTAGFQVRALTDPLQVLEVLSVFDPDLILLDLNMPGADGAELATIIREQDPCHAVPILFLSVERDPGRQLEALNMGGDAFLTKPIDPALLIRTVTRRIESRQLSRRRFEFSDRCDPTTGLANRRYFLMTLERAVAESTAAPPGSGLLLLALDGITSLAEQLGPGGLDLVRNRLGRRILELLTPDDLATCLDDHYHALLLRRPEPEDLRQTAETLCRAVAAVPLMVAEQSVPVTLSIGLGLVRGAPGDALTLLSRAEQACAAAQRKGGNRVAVYQPTDDGPESVFHQQRIDALIAAALATPRPDQGFRLFYQPLVPVGAQGRRCLEVQLRLSEEDGTLMPARDFLPIAERSGRTTAIDHWLLDNALRGLAWQCSVQPGLSFLVRQHLESLTAPGRVAQLFGQLTAQGLAPQTLLLGLDQGNLLEQRRLGTILVKMLRKLGMEVCLLEADQSPVTLDLVAELRPALVRLTVEALRDDPQKRLGPFVRRLRQLGVEVVATGIDTPAQIGPVWAGGISYVQGVLIQPPLAEPVFDWDQVVVG